MNTEQAIKAMEYASTRLCRGWVVDDENRNAVTMCASWLAREPYEGMDTGKGLLLLGAVGTGKTMLLKIVRHAMLENYKTQFGIRSCQDLVRQFTNEGYDAVRGWMEAPHCAFDDLGAEGEATHYGIHTNLMAEIIEARYERLVGGHRCWTHFTTNMGTDDIAKRYGARAYSRLSHMCNVVNLGASVGSTDRRRSAPVPLPEVKPVNADNIYNVVHPSIAAKLREAVKVVTVNKPKEVERSYTSMERDLEALRKRVRAETKEAIEVAMEKIANANDAHTARPFLQVLREELESREVTNG